MNNWNPIVVTMLYKTDDAIRMSNFSEVKRLNLLFWRSWGLSVIIVGKLGGLQDDRRKSLIIEIRPSTSKMYVPVFWKICLGALES